MALMWLMDKENEDAVELEKVKAQITALANHPNTQNEFLKTLFDEDKEPEEFEDMEVRWQTPQTEEELAELNQYLDGIV